MAVRITDSCIACGACEWECPTTAISPGTLRPVVDASLCTECYGFYGESQCVIVCPTDAIVVRPEPEAVLLARFTRHHPDRPPQSLWAWQRRGSGEA